MAHSTMHLGSSQHTGPQVFNQGHQSLLQNKPHVTYANSTKNQIIIQICSDAYFYLHKAKKPAPPYIYGFINSVHRTFLNTYIESVSAPKTQLHSWSLEQDNDIYFANCFETTCLSFMTQRQLQATLFCWITFHYYENTFQ